MPAVCSLVVANAHGAYALRDDQAELAWVRADNGSVDHGSWVNKPGSVTRVMGQYLLNH